jgi:formylglycine-generating enzyme required for sulfatase activity
MAFPGGRRRRGWLRVTRWLAGLALLVAVALLATAGGRAGNAPEAPPPPPAPPTRLNPVDGSLMVWVPPGTFQMGAEDGAENERPVHTVRLTRGFWMYRTEVTNAQWLRFLAAHPKHQRPKYAHQARLMRPEQPAVAISYDDAVAYCRWAKVRLPTEAEWEWAARGADGRRYPWGNWEPDPRLAVFFRSINLASPEAVGTRPDGASPFGVLDMAGNAWEWTSDWYAPYPSAAQTDPTGPATGKKHVIRGGGWINPMERLRTTVRGFGRPARRSGHIGFRPVCDAPPPTEASR